MVGQARIAGSGDDLGGVDPQGRRPRFRDSRIPAGCSGDPTTPVGRWVLSQRFESTRILAANVDK